MKEKELKTEIINILKTKGVDENTIKAIELITTERKIRIETKDGKEYIQKGEVIHKRGLYENFCTINQNFFLYIVECKLTGTVRRVLDVMIAYMEKDNLANITAADIANISKISKGSISNAIKELIKYKIIFQESQYGREKKYKINYSINKNMAVKSRQTDKKYLDYHKVEMKAQERDMMLNGMEIPMRTNVAKGLFEGTQEMITAPPKKENETSIIEKLKNEILELKKENKNQETIMHKVMDLQRKMEKEYRKEYDYRKMIEKAYLVDV